MPEPLRPAAQAIADFVLDPAANIIVRLAKSAIPDPLEKLSLADLVEADFVGYAPVRVSAVTFLDQVEEDIAEAESEEHFFVAGAIVAPQVITARYVTYQKGSDPVQLWDIEIYEQPVVMDQAGLAIAGITRFVGTPD